MNQLHRRLWLKQTALATLGIGFSLDSLAGEDYLPKAAGKESGFLNLGSNENPYGIAPMAKKAIASLVDSAHRYQYNIPSLQSFRKELAAHYGVTADHILLTPGSGEALNLLARHYSKGNLVTATPTFGILPNTAKKIGVPVKEIPLDEGKVHDLPALLQAIDASTAQVYLCNPANPTGTILDPEALKTFCQQAAEKTVVTIDEAYIDFLDAPYNESMIGLVKSGNPNIVVLRTFSKIHAMAGMRVGFVVAHPDTIKALQANYFGNSNFCMSALSMTAAMASLKDGSHSRMSKEKNAAARSFTQKSLEEMGHRVIPSYTNFIYYHLGNYPGDFAADMLKKQVLLRSSEQPDGKWCRVSIGTLEEMQQFIRILRKS